MRVIKEYEPCKRYEGTGIATNGERYGESDYNSWECLECQGYGKNLINKTIEKEDEYAATRRFPNWN